MREGRDVELSPTTPGTFDYRRVRYDIPRISACENAAAYSKEQIQQIAAHLRANQPWWRLYEASGAWRAAGQSLELVSSTLKQVNAVLADGWRSQDAVACQHSMQRLEGTARHLADRAQKMATYTQEAGTVLAHAAERFPREEPGFFERNFDYATLDRINPFHHGPSEEDYRHVLATLNNDLLMVNTMLPTHVSGEFGTPTAADRVPDGGGSGGTSTSGVGGAAAIGTAGGSAVGGSAVGGSAVAASAVGSTPGTVTAPPTAGSGGSAPVIGRLEDGSTGGLAGAAPPPATGTGAPAPGATPANVTTSAPVAGAPVAAGPIATGAVGAGNRATAGHAVSAGPGRPATAQPGLIGGRAGATPGVIGGQSAAPSAAGRAARGRGQAGAAGAPMARGGRGRDPDEAARDTWLTEDEDLWHDPDTAPAVIE